MLIERHNIHCPKKMDKNARNGMHNTTKTTQK